MKSIQHPAYSKANLPAPVPYTLHIGVTGHRELPYPAPTAKEVERSLAMIQEMFGSHFPEKAGQVAKKANFFLRWEKAFFGFILNIYRFLFPKKSVAANRTTSVKYRVFSCLAKGADRMVAGAAIKLMNAELEAILPFEADEYRKDFNEKADENEFNAFLAQAAKTFHFKHAGEPVNRPHFYKKAGEKMVQQSEIVIAIWNGKPANGIGGTAEIVEYALSLNRLVLWIHSDKPENSACIIRSIKKENNSHGITTTDIHSCWNEITHQYQQLCTYNQDAPVISGVYDANYQRNIMEASSISKVSGLPDSIDFSNIISGFTIADQLAIYYQSIHLKTTSWVYRLTAFSILASVFQALFFPEYTILIGAELILLLAALIGYRMGIHAQWHDKWLVYRHLAERLRSLTFAGLVFTEDERNEKENESSFPFYFSPGSWLQDVCDYALLNFQRKVPVSLTNLKPFILEGWINNQSKFHAKNAIRKSKAVKKEHLTVLLLLMFTLLAIFLHVIPIFHTAILRNLITLLAIVLPAFAASKHAISVVMDNERIGIRSQLMKNVLDLFASNLINADNESEFKTEIRKIESVMSSENQEWFASLSFHKVSYPV